ncbi:hypothetical protein GLOIN_2v1790055 [Rhizophagus clarus]|uniref:Uncharacterized protein n=1 Tax=Rhizophagus clarus TaxID=94130 RepID=A0A8H3L8J9_9GLOM|nr:hypothetical protein GLOIN_2v1790055 [Rhizophagus clarus]
MSTILDDGDLNYPNINLNKSNTSNNAENNTSTLIQKKKPIEMKSHLSLRCSKVTNNVKMEYLYAISSSEDSSSAQPTIMMIIIFAFFHDFVKCLCFKYELLKQTILSTTYLDAETANITLKRIASSKDLTLELTHESAHLDRIFMHL